jgi:2-oxoglutarate/2-oxoacid ferredoxin oxidoreductase subunit alpha
MPDQEVALGETGGRLAVVGWGSDLRPDPPGGAPRPQTGLDVSHIHVRHIWPLPKNLGELLAGFDRVIVPEMNTGQFKTAAARPVSRRRRQPDQDQGQPFKIAEIEAADRGAGMRRRRLEGYDPNAPLPLILMLMTWSSPPG